MFAKLFLLRLSVLNRYGYGTGKICSSFRYYSQKWSTEEESSLETYVQTNEDLKIIRRNFVEKIEKFGFLSSKSLSEVQVQLSKGKHDKNFLSVTKLLIDYCGRWCAELSSETRMKIANELFGNVKYKSIHIHNAYLLCRNQNDFFFDPLVVEQKLLVANLEPTRHTLIQFLGQYALSGDVENALDIINRHKKHSFDILPIAWGYLAMAFSASGSVEKSLEIVNKLKAQDNANWHFYCLVCSGLIQAGAASTAVELFDDCSRHNTEPVSIVPFVRLMEYMLEKDLLSEATAKIAFLPSCGQQLLMHAIHHLIPCSGGMELIKQMQEKLECPILGKEPEIVDTASFLIWHLLSECRSFEHLLSQLELTQKSFNDVPVLDFALEMALSTSNQYTKDLLLKFESDGCLKPHFVLPVLFEKNPDQNVKEQYDFVASLVSSQSLMKEIAAFLATDLQATPNWWLVYLFFLKHGLESQAKELLQDIESVPSHQIIDDSLISGHVSDVLITNAAEIVEQCSRVKDFPISYVQSVLITSLCNHGEIVEACKHATDYYSLNNKLDTKLQIALLQGSLVHSTPLPSPILGMLSEELQTMEKQMQANNTTGVFETLCKIWGENDALPEDFMNCIVDCLPADEYLKYVSIAEKAFAFKQTNKNVVLRKRMLQSLFKDCPEKAFQFVKSLCLGGQNINRFQTWQLMEFVELCSEHDCPDLLEKLSGYNLSYNLSAKIAAHKAFIGVKSGEWTVPDKDDRRFFHLTMLQLAGIVATQKDSSYAKKLIKLAEAQYNPYYLEFTYVCLIVMGYNKKIPYILSQKLTDQNVANIRASVYRTAFDAHSLITADKTMRAVKTTSLKWQITLNFYLFRQAIYLVSSKRCLSALYDYLLEQFNRINPEENYPETKDWLDLLTDAHKSGNFATIDLECEKLRQQKKKRFQKTRSSNDELATFFD